MNQVINEAVKRLTTKYPSLAHVADDLYQDVRSFVWEASLTFTSPANLEDQVRAFLTENEDELVGLYLHDHTEAA